MVREFIGDREDEDVRSEEEGVREFESSMIREFIGGVAGESIESIESIESVESIS